MEERQGLNRRNLLTGALAGVSAIPFSARAAGYDAVVGQGGFSDVRSAIDAAPAKPDRPFRILVRKGVWKAKLDINKPFIHLIGEDRTGSELNFDAAAGLKAPDGTAWGTFRSASVTINAPDCAIRNMRVTNNFDYVGARAVGPANPAGANLQALALAVMREADRTLIEDVDMTGYQDTLLTNAGRALYRNTSISGSVDYIFGGGIGYFEKCRIITRGRPDMTGARQGYITAPSTRAGSTYGLIFDRCRLEKEVALRPGVIALGRPWRGNADAIGQSVFLNCWMDNHIDKMGWDRMAYGRGADGQSLWFEPEQARFYEFASTGPGAAKTPQRRQLTADEARFFARDRVLAGWKP